MRRALLSIFFLTFLTLTFPIMGQTGFIQTDGTLLRDEEGDLFRIKGIALGNNVWSNPSTPVKTHHNEKDYERLNEMGFNSVRFYINYGLFESDNKPFSYKESGFKWIDQNITWARKHNIRLILNMHYPQGGFQSNGEGEALWKIEKNQRRFIALWKEIARRYANEPTILGYSLLNEPFLESSFEQYEKLLQKTTDEIRSVDPNHILIIEKANALRWSWNDNENGDLNFVTIDDPQVMYEFHFYEPMEMTHQNAPWTYLKGQFSSYPDLSHYKVSGDSQWKSTTWDVPVLDVKRSKQNKWTFVESPLIKISNTEYAYGVPTFQARALGNNGSAYTKDFVIKEFDEQKNYLRTLMSLDEIEGGGWYYWSSNSTGDGTFETPSGKEQRTLKIKGSTQDANLSYSQGKFPLKQGHYYQISGSLMAKNVQPGAEIRLRIDFYTLDGEIVPLDKSFLEMRLKRYIDWGEKNQVPLYLGEFGMIADGFKEGRGGLQWVEDMLDICQKYNVNFNYHTYHEYKTFGLYRTAADQLPGDPNMPLVELFREKLF